jgi:hypothetical protein
VYISTGAGARVALPDRKVAAVIAAMRPSLRAANYDAAVEQARLSISPAAAPCPRRSCLVCRRMKESHWLRLGGTASQATAFMPEQYDWHLRSCTSAPMLLSAVLSSSAVGCADMSIERAAKAAFACFDSHVLPLRLSAGTQKKY